ncbi:M16 family metallopeptidase [Psychrobacter sp. I-STPA6b]|uniref:M16 family metallopeptidase n=1 Tax=Psychrobacter sp. I-STPA6b TaxID=2585718 RepID=UPI001D0C481C|nr:pitrilysin family protein [Psychrobacter sp. I-STPA6b]
MHTLHHKKSSTQPTRHFRQHLLASVLAILTLSTTATVYAMPTETEERRATEVDTSQPIVAIDKLDSLKQNEPLHMTLPDIQHFTTDNGVPVAFVRTDELPMVDISLRFNAGSARDNAIRPDGFGIANMTATMLSQGTKNLNEDEFATATEQLGINLGAGAYKDMFVISLRSLSDDAHLEPALALFADMLQNPVFDENILQRNKAQLMLGLQQQQQNPSNVASKAFIQALYGDHPYAHPSSGTLETVPSISQTDLQQFWQKFLVARNANIAITGNLTEQQAKQIANQLTSILPQGEPAPALPEPKPRTSAERIDIPFDSTQTTVMIGQLGNTRTRDPQQMQEQTNFAIGNHILAGGDFNARLMTEIRKNRGYTYGISGGMSPMQAKGPYLISFSTRNDKAEDAINATLETIEQTLQTGVDDKEVTLTKDNLTNSFPMSFASNASINAMLGMMGFYQLPDSYLTEYVQRIENSNTNTVNQSLRSTLTPENFLIVTVGQPSASNGNNDSNNKDSGDNRDKE